MRDLRCRMGLPVLALVILLAASCGGEAEPVAARVGSSSSGPAATVGTTTYPSLPNPFTIVARYSAASLGLNQPSNLAIGPDGNLYVTDSSQRVTVASPQGKVLRRWGRPGKGKGEFSFIIDPTGNTAPIAVGADGIVYVVDTGNTRVEVFSPTGAFLREFGSYGSGRGQLLFPNDVAVDRNGNVYIADDRQQAVTKFSSRGAFEWRIGGPSASDPDLRGHFHLSSVDPHGRLVASIDEIGLTLYFDARGHKIDSFRSNGCDVTVDAGGYAYVTDCLERYLSPHSVWVFDRNHRLVGQWIDCGFGWSPRFGPNGEIFTIGQDGSILRLEVALPGA